MAELKSCPFCGRVPIIENCKDFGYFVKCKCGIEQSTLYAQKCDAVKRWNGRKTEPSMTEDDAFYIVYKDLTKDEGLFTGRYDAKHGSKQYMHGVSSVMEYIAYKVGEDCLDAFNEHFVSNLIESEEKTERSE